MRARAILLLPIPFAGRGDKCFTLLIYCRRRSEEVKYIINYVGALTLILCFFFAPASRGVR